MSLFTPVLPYSVSKTSVLIVSVMAGVLLVGCGSSSSSRHLNLAIIGYDTTAELKPQGIFP